VPRGYQIDQSSGNEEPLELALRAIARRERSTAELTRWLLERGVADDDVETAVAHLQDIGELDDARFARRYAEDKRELAGWGAERIRDALVERRVAPEHIEAALSAEDGADQVERAIRVLERRGRTVDSEADRARALGHLTRKGYSYEIAYDAIRHYTGP
jgi:regulatory protein